MADINSAIKTVRGGIEATIGATPSSWTYLEPEGDPLFPEVDVEKLTRTGQRDGGSVATRCVGVTTAQAALSLNLRGDGSGAGDGNTAGTGELGELLDCALGVTGNSDDGSTIASATGSTITVGAGEGAGFTVGNAVMYQTTAGGFEVRFITGISTDVLTLDRAPTVAVSASDYLYASTSWRANQTDAEHDYYRLEVYDDDNWSKALKSCSVLGTMNVPATGKAMVDFALVANGATEVNSGASAPTFVEASSACAIPIQGIAMHLGSALTETIDTTLSFGFAVVPRSSQYGDNGVSGHSYAWEGAKFTGKIFFDATIYAAMRSTTTYDVLLQVGSERGNAAAVRMPAVDFTAKHTTSGGLDVIEFEGIATGLAAFDFALFA